MKLQTFFYYYGGKHDCAQAYPKPIHKTIIEPFAGSAGYACKHSQYNVILNDCDPVIAGIWDYLIHVPEAEFRRLPDDIEDISELNGSTPPEAKHLIGFNLAFGRARPAHKSTEWVKEHRARRKRGTGRWCPNKKLVLANQLQFIRHWMVTCDDYKSCPDIKGTWFVDPPYDSKAGRGYVCKFTEFDRLAQWVHMRQGQVIVCEQEGAQWLDFKKFKQIAVSNGTSKEAIYRKGCSRLFPDL